MTLRLPHRLIAAAVAGLVAQSAFPQTVFAPGAALGIVALLWLLRDLRTRDGALLGFVFGVAFFLPLLRWLAAFGALGVGLLALSQAAWLAAFGALAARGRWGRREPGGAISVAVIFTGIEFLRGTMPLGGFEWGSLGYASGTTLGNLAPFGGVRLVTLWLVLEAAALLTVARCMRRPLAVLILATFAVPTLAGLIPTGIGPPAPDIEIAVVQGSGPEERLTGLPRRGRVGPEDEIIIRNHLRETATIASQGPPDLIIWPENSFDQDPRSLEELFALTIEQIDRLGVPFLIGAITNDADGKQRNSTLLVEPGEGITDQVAKQHLVPFGEFVPWGWPRRVLPVLQEYLPDDLTPGEGKGTLSVAGVTIGTAICFESTYPRDIRRIVGDGAELIVVSTNNASYGRSLASRQHLEMGLMRARENGKPVVQAAISGITAFLSPDGDVRQATGLFDETVVRQIVTPMKGRTWYARYGRGFEMLLVAAMFILMALDEWQRRRPLRHADADS